MNEDIKFASLTGDAIQKIPSNYDPVAILKIYDLKKNSLFEQDPIDKMRVLKESLDNLDIVEVISTIKNPTDLFLERLDSNEFKNNVEALQFYNYLLGFYPDENSEAIISTRLEKIYEEKPLLQKHSKIKEKPKLLFKSDYKPNNENKLKQKLSL